MPRQIGARMADELGWMGALTILIDGTHLTRP